MAVLLFVIAGLVILLSSPIAYWLSRATEIGALLREKLANFNQPLALLEELRNMIGTGGPRPLKVVESQGIVSTLVSTITPVVSQLGLFTGSLLFYLIYQQNVRSRLVQTMPDREARLTMLRTLNDIDENMTQLFRCFHDCQHLPRHCNRRAHMVRQPTQPSPVGCARRASQLHPLSRASHRRGHSLLSKSTCLFDRRRGRRAAVGFLRSGGGAGTIFRSGADGPKKRT